VGEIKGFLSYSAKKTDGTNLPSGVGSRQRNDLAAWVLAECRDENRSPVITADVPTLIRPEFTLWHSLLTGKLTGNLFESCSQLLRLIADVQACSRRYYGKSLCGGAGNFFEGNREFSCVQQGG
jgi:hypothetical protein